MTETKKSREGAGIVGIALAVIAASLGYYILIGLGWMAAQLFPESRWPYEVQYTTTKVRVDAKPEDCDFLYRPIGKKGCHYEKLVNVSKSFFTGTIWKVTETVDGAGSHESDETLYGIDVNTHRPIFSQDGGKTWNWLADGLKPPSSDSTEIYVRWEKKGNSE